MKGLQTFILLYNLVLNNDKLVPLISKMQPLKMKPWEGNAKQWFISVCASISYLFAGDILEILARHDASEFGFDKALCPLSLWRPTRD